MRSIKVITQPAVEPVTVEEAKLCAHISHDVENDLVEHWIRAGRQLAEDYQWRAYFTQTVRVKYDYYPRFPLCLPRAPLQSLVSVSYTDDDGITTTIDNSNFIVDTDSEPGRLALVSGFAIPSTTLQGIGCFAITFVAGEESIANIDTRVKEAILLYCTYRNENRAGEVDVPDAFYHLLRPNRLHL